MRIEKENTLRKAILLQIDGRGKTKIALEGYPAMLKLWALQNTKGKSKTYIAFKDDRRIFVLYEGRGKESNFPKITDFPEENEYQSLFFSSVFSALRGGFLQFRLEFFPFFLPGRPIFPGHGAGNIQHRQHGEDERLHQSAENIKIDAQHRRQADPQQRNISQETGKASQQ